jgi:hypothetical protein
MKFRENMFLFIRCFDLLTQIVAKKTVALYWNSTEFLQSRNTAVIVPKASIIS